MNMSICHSVKVWCGIYQSKILGLIFFYGNLNLWIYINILRGEISPLIEGEIPPCKCNNLIWQQDGVPYHRGNCWIGQNAAISWLAHTPDLIPLDFFLRGKENDLIWPMI